MWKATPSRKWGVLLVCSSTRWNLARVSVWTASNVSKKEWSMTGEIYVFDLFFTSESLSQSLVPLYIRFLEISTRCDWFDSTRRQIQVVLGSNYSINRALCTQNKTTGLGLLLLKKKKKSHRMDRLELPRFARARLVLLKRSWRTICPPEIDCSNRVTNNLQSNNIRRSCIQ